MSRTYSAGDDIWFHAEDDGDPNVGTVLSDESEDVRIRVGEGELLVSKDQCSPSERELFGDESHRNFQQEGVRSETESDINE